MRIFALDKFFLFLIIWSGVKGKWITSCNRPISIKCLPEQDIIIMNVNTTTDIALQLLENCNTHTECVVKDVYECVKVSYWCRMNFPIMAVKKSNISELITKLSWLGIMSVKYQEGQYQEAEDITCNLRIVGHKSHPRGNATIYIYEFAPFTNSSEYCLTVNGHQTPLICSGSRKFNTEHGPFDIRKGLQFHLQLVNGAEVPQVRFWIDLDVSSDEEKVYYLECNSQAVTDPTNSLVSQTSMTVSHTREPASQTTALVEDETPSLGFPTVIALILMAGALLIAAVAILVVMVVQLCRPSKSQCTSKESTDRNCNTDTSDEHLYNYIPSTPRLAQGETAGLGNDGNSLRMFNSLAASRQTLPLPEIPYEEDQGQDTDDIDGYLAPGYSVGGAVMKNDEDMTGREEKYLEYPECMKQEDISQAQFSGDQHKHEDRKDHDKLPMSSTDEDPLCTAINKNAEHEDNIESEKGADESLGTENTEDALMAEASYLPTSSNDSSAGVSTEVSMTDCEVFPRENSSQSDQRVQEDLTPADNFSIFSVYL